MGNNPKQNEKVHDPRGNGRERAWDTSAILE